MQKILSLEDAWYIEIFVRNIKAISTIQSVPFPTSIKINRNLDDIREILKKVLVSVEPKSFKGDTRLCRPDKISCFGEQKTQD